MIDPNELVHVVVTVKPQRVWVVFQGQFHYARYRTLNPGETGGLRDVEGNPHLICACLNTWNGQSHFTCKYSELNDGGYGISWE